MSVIFRLLCTSCYVCSARILFAGFNQHKVIIAVYTCSLSPHVYQAARCRFSLHPLEILITNPMIYTTMVFLAIADSPTPTVRVWWGTPFVSTGYVQAEQDSLQKETCVASSRTVSYIPLFLKNQMALIVSFWNDAVSVDYSTKETQGSRSILACLVK